MLRSKGMYDVLLRFYLPKVFVGEVLLELSEGGVH
jgi:hypothetical protein